MDRADHHPDLWLLPAADGPGVRLAAFLSALDPGSRSTRLRSLDGWRGLCILLVLVGHFVPGCINLSGAGVDFFFVLSGTLMARLLVAERQPIARFMLRRVARIVPGLAAYVLTVAILLNLSLLLQGGALRLASPLAALFFYHNYLGAADVSCLFEHTWSLAVEEHGYLLLAAIVLLARRSPGFSAALAVAAILASTALGWWMAAHHPPGSQFVTWRTEIRVRPILTGFVACLAIRPLLASPRWRTSWIAPLAAGAALIWQAIGVDPAAPAALGCSLLAAVAVNGLDAGPDWLGRIMAAPALVVLGTLSFSIYLWQQLFFSLGHFGLPAAAGLAMTMACSLYSFVRVERPARAWLNGRPGALRA